MEPENLCSSLLHNWLIGVCFSKSPYIFKFTGGESLHAWEFVFQVFGKLVNDFGSPALLLLTDKDILPNLPAEQDQFAIDCQGNTNLSGADTLFKGLEKIVILAQLGQINMDR
jgi:hypothetical protein